MKKHAPATLRNREAIARVLSKELPQKGTVLEVASGSGEHAIFFSARFANLQWQPSDVSTDALASIRAYSRDHKVKNLSDPTLIDAQLPKAWAIPANIAATVCINMIHISAYASCIGLFAGCARLVDSTDTARVLGSKGFPVIIYGPFFEQGVESAQSNLAFDLSLRDRDPSWGIRDVEKIDSTAQEHGFKRTARYKMPANNLMLVYRAQ